MALSQKFPLPPVTKFQYHRVLNVTWQNGTKVCSPSSASFPVHFLVNPLSALSSLISLPSLSFPSTCSIISLPSRDKVNKTELPPSSELWIYSSLIPKIFSQYFNKSKMSERGWMLKTRKIIILFFAINKLNHLPCFTLTFKSCRCFGMAG